jgi:hypothetical protein
MTRLVLIVALGLNSALVAAAGFELNGHGLGERVDEVLNDPRYDCGGVSPCFLFTACSLKQPEQEMLRGARLEGLILYYAGERIAAIEAQFAPEHFQRVAEDTARQYGSAEAQSTSQTAPSNVIYVWRQGRRLLRLERLFAPTGRSSLIITDQSFLSELVDRGQK